MAVRSSKIKIFSSPDGDICLKQFSVHLSLSGDSSSLELGERVSVPSLCTVKSTSERE